MRAAVITRTVLLRILSSPSGVLGAVALLCALPILLVLAPVGLSSRNTAPAELVYEIAFGGWIVGVALGLEALERIAPILAREPSGERLVWESVALLACGSIGAALPLLSAVACGASSAVAVGIPFVRTLSALMTTVAAGTMILRLGPSRGMAPWLFASGILLAPMILPQPASPLSLVAMTGAFLLAAWLLDRAPSVLGAAGIAGSAPTRRELR